MAKTTSIALALALEEEAKRRREVQEAQIRRDESLAERFAAPDLRREQIELLQTERRLGAPEVEAGLHEDRLSFTDPTGFKRTFSPGGSMTSFTLPTTLSNQYTPRDQKKIQDLYQQRSDIATSPELDGDEDARQNALDEIDASINRIPHIPPTLKEPTAQQQFNAALVRGPNGQMGTWDGKKFNPIEDSKGEVAQQAKWTKDYQSEYNRLLKIEDSGDTPEMLNAKSAQYADLMAVATRSMGRFAGTTAEVPLRQEGTVTVHPDLPKTLEPLWPKLTDEEKEETRAALAIGVTAQQILDMYKKAVR